MTTNAEQLASTGYTPATPPPGPLSQTYGGFLASNSPGAGGAGTAPQWGPGAGPTSTGGGGGGDTSGLPFSFANALTQFGAPATSPFADLIANAQKIAAQRRAQIETDYKGYAADASAQGAHDIAGANSLATRFTDSGLDTFMDSFVASKVAESDKRLKDLAAGKEKALTEADTQMLQTISDLQLKEMQRNDTLRQQQVDNAFKLINTQQTAYEQSPAFLRMKAIFSDAEMLRAGVTSSDTPEQIQAKLSKLPMTEEQKLNLEKLKAEIAATNRSNRGGGGAAGAVKPAAGDLTNVQQSLAASKGGDGYTNTATYRQWKQVMESKYPGFDFGSYFPPSSWLNPQDQSAYTLFGSKPGFTNQQSPL